ncbi:nucleotide pyrophosphohydrolase [Nonomuraea glycinis]|uniref:nucleotide pyrophosphohydrolase n=1 Tax=Nonomuraea glycinis TaxID=2047744 RepID=UPI002E0EAF55|nr:nucleotide pyrophosphohydrolase [Nonomuraea glycinis]
MTDLERLAAHLHQFAEARDWEQFHTPKNLAMALAGEVGELVAEFQWLTAEESSAPDPPTLARISAELGDVTNYLVRLADVLGVDLVQAAEAKIASSERRYPPDLYRGSARKAPPDPHPPLL